MTDCLRMAAAVTGFALAVLFQPAFAAQPDQWKQDTPDPTTIKAPARFEFYVRNGLPAEYRGKVNPNLEPTIPIVIKGADIYAARCASCHGLMGFGNGEVAGKQRTKPADLAWSLSNVQVKDDYLLWTIAEGGSQFGTSMPAYKKELRQDQIWQVITYMRAAFEGREAMAPRGRDHAKLTTTAGR